VWPGLVDPGIRGDRRASLLGGEREATGPLVFAQALPCEAVPGLADSRSYAQWAGQWPDAGSDAYA